MYNDYDDLDIYGYEYGGDYFDMGYDDYDDDPETSDYDAYYEWVNEVAMDAYYASWRGRLQLFRKSLNNRVTRLINWLKWHNRKCKHCEKPALHDGEVCHDCWIPY